MIDDFTHGKWTWERDFMRIRLKGSLKTRLIASFAILLLVPSLLIGILSYQSAKTKVEDQMVVGGKDTVYFLNNTIDMLVSPKVHQIQYFAQTLKAKGDQPQDREEAKLRLEQYIHTQPEIYNAYLGTETGKMFITPNSNLPAGYDPRKRDWYKQAVEKNGEPYITPPYQDLSTGKIVVSIVMELKDGAGVVGFDLSLENLSELAKSFKIGSEGYAYILDQTGNVLVHPTLENGTEAKGSQFDPLFSQENGTFSNQEGGTATQTIFATNKLTGWKLAGVLPASELEQAVAPIFKSSSVVIAIAIILGAVVIVLIVRSITKPLRRLMDATFKISQGDLRERVAVDADDELGHLAARFNQMVDSLAALITGVRQTVDQLALSSEELTASSQQTAEASEHISASIQQVAASTETQVQSVRQSEQSIGHFSIGVQQISTSAVHVSQAASNSSDLAETGSTSLETAVRQMGKIHETIANVSTVIQGLGNCSQEIGQIVEEITGIASQTNLLALNAAIEAARAGEQGRGFAIVADEVRKLAEQSSRSAAKITGLTATIQSETTQAIHSIAAGSQEVETGMKVVAEAEESFGKIKRSVQEVTGQIQEVSAASQQMSASTDQLLGASRVIRELAVETANGADGISSASQQQLAAMEEISSSAFSLSRMAEELQEMVSKFQV